MCLPRLTALASLLIASAASAQDPEFVRTWEAAQRERPAALSSQARIAPEGEPGAPLVIRGRVYLADGKRPAPGVVVFAYQTDARGLYNAPGAPGWRLEGWAKTDAEGRFTFRTVRPGPYPSRNTPEHVHFTLEGPGVPRQWTADLEFADDPLMPRARRAESDRAGPFAWVRPVTRGKDGVQEVSLSLRASDKNRF